MTPPALEAIVSAIGRQASALDRDGQSAIDAIVKEYGKLAEVVERHLAAPVEFRH
jgi:hypothetical protein